VDDALQTLSDSLTPSLIESLSGDVSHWFCSPRTRRANSSRSSNAQSTSTASSIVSTSVPTPAPLQETLPSDVLQHLYAYLNSVPNIFVPNSSESTAVSVRHGQPCCDPSLDASADVAPPAASRCNQLSREEVPAQREGSVETDRSGSEATKGSAAQFQRERKKNAKEQGVLRSCQQVEEVSLLVPLPPAQDEPPILQHDYTTPTPSSSDAATTSVAPHPATATTDTTRPLVPPTPYGEERSCDESTATFGFRMICQRVEIHPAVSPIHEDDTPKGPPEDPAMEKGTEVMIDVLNLPQGEWGAEETESRPPTTGSLDSPPVLKDIDPTVEVPFEMLKPPKGKDKQWGCKTLSPLLPSADSPFLPTKSTPPRGTMTLKLGNGQPQRLVSAMMSPRDQEDRPFFTCLSQDRVSTLPLSLTISR
jgi:hypothetical protein